jgi:hypothetical protein
VRKACCNAGPHNYINVRKACCNAGPHNYINVRRACCNAGPHNYINVGQTPRRGAILLESFGVESVVFGNARDEPTWFTRSSSLKHLSSCSSPIPLEFAANLIYLYYPVYCSTFAF